MRSRNQIMMRQMEEFVDDYYMTHHTTPKLQEIADNFHTVKSTVSRYLTEIRYGSASSKRQAKVRSL